MNHPIFKKNLKIKSYKYYLKLKTMNKNVKNYKIPVKLFLKKEFVDM